MELDSGNTQDAFKVHSGSFDTLRTFGQDSKWLAIRFSLE